MPGRSSDDVIPSGHELADATDEQVESGTDSQAADEDSGAEAIAMLGLEARAELERLRARLGLLDAGAGSSEEPAPPSVVGRYRLLERIGQGGMGVVYRAHDPQLGRAVAIKLVHAPAFGAPDKLRARLLREAMVLAKLAHPNVVRVYDCGEHEGEVYLAMEHVQGTTLHEWQRAPGRTPAAIVEAYVAAANGLAAAHAMGIVHRDFKPDNVLVADDGRILVGDFGLAVAGVDELAPRLDDAEPEAAGVPLGITKTGALLGTVLYMSPEQLRGDPATAQSDQFALCVALWEALAGTRPFEGADPAVLLAAIEEGRPRGGERLPKRLRRALERGLASAASERFDDVAALIEAIGHRRGLSAPIVVALVGASVGLGLLAYPLLFQPAPAAAECGLERAVAEARESTAWAGVHERLDAAGLGAGLGRLDQHLQRLEAQARTLCERTTGPGDEARHQHLQSWVEDLGGFLDTAEGRSIGELLDDIEGLENARLTAPPPRALDERVVEARDQSHALERRGEMAAALTAAERAVALAGDRSLELAVAQQRRGRVLSLLGEYDEAVEAYRVANAEAEASSYDDARLDVRLVAATTAIMRLEQLERGQDALEDARGLLARLDEPWPSPRRAHYNELRATVRKRKGQGDEALAEQWLAILQYTLLDRPHDVGLAYTNLGTIYEWRSLAREPDPDDLRRARVSYEHGLELLAPTRPSPSWGTAAYDLGHWLAQNGEPEDWSRAEALLEDVRANHLERRLPALQDLLMLGMQRDAGAELAPLVRELDSVLRRQPPASPNEALGAWSIAALAAADMGDAAAFERALTEAESAAAAIVRNGDQPPAEVAVRVMELEANAAQLFADADPARARALALAVRERLEALPPADRPAQVVSAIEEILGIERPISLPGITTK